MKIFKKSAFAALMLALSMNVIANANISSNEKGDNENSNTNSPAICSLTNFNKMHNDCAFDWNDVIDAIAQVESKGNPKAFNPRGNYAGLLQIGPLLVKECNNIMKQKKSSVRYTLADRYDPVKSKEMFVLIQEKYNPGHNIERAIRLWNGGPGYNVRSTNRYYAQVKKHL